MKKAAELIKNVISEAKPEEPLQSSEQADTLIEESKTTDATEETKEETAADSATPSEAEQ